MSDSERRKKLIEIYQKNPLVFFQRELLIKTKDQLLSPFRPNPMQMKVLSYIYYCMEKQIPIRVIILKARQMGMSTFWEALLFWRCSLNSNVYGITLAHDKDTSQELFEKTKVFYDNMNPLIKPMRRYSSKKELVFEKPERFKKGDPIAGISLGSKMQIQTAGNIHSGAGSTCHFLHASEFGRYAYAEEFKSSMFPAIPYLPLTFIGIESTAWLAGTVFYEECQAAKEGESGFKYFFFAWHEHPDYQIALDPGEEFTLDAEERDGMEEYGWTLPQIKWRRMKIKEMGYDMNKFRREFPSNEEEAWITSGDRVFDEQILLRLKETVNYPRYIGDIVSGRLFPQWEKVSEKENHLCVWELPKKNCLYDIGADPSLGSDADDADKSVAIVIERETKRVVALWRGLIDPIDFARELEKIGNFYNEAQINCEINGIGFSTNASLSESYGNLYRWRYRDEVVPRLTKKTGYQTTPQTKKYLVVLARSIMRSIPPIRSMTLWNELNAYVDYGNDSFQGAVGFHDDCVMALFLAWVAADDETLKGYVEDDVVEDKEDKHPLVIQATQFDTWDPENVVTSKSIYDL